MVSVLVFIYLFSSSPSPQHHQQSHHHQQHVVENVYRTRNREPILVLHFALHPLCGLGEIPWPFWPSFPKGSQPRPHSSCDTTDQAEEAPSLLQGCLRADSEASCHMQNTRKTHRKSPSPLHSVAPTAPTHREKGKGPLGPSCAGPEAGTLP